MPWQPILEGRPAREAVCVALELARALEAKLAEPITDLSLRSGAAGQALMFHYAALHPLEGHFADTASGLLQQIVERLPGVRLSPSFHDGFTGIGWVSEHLERKAPDDDAADEADEQDEPDAIESALDSVLSTRIPRGAHELGSGIVGFGIYARERLPRLAAHRVLARIVEELERLADRPERRACWRTPATRTEDLGRYPEGWYNLGIAHGIGGVIGLLARIRDGRDGGRDALLRGAVDWLLEQRLAAPGASFPAAVGQNVVPEPANPGWCYGDLGLATVLLAAAQALDATAWRDQAIVLAARAADQRDDLSRVRNPGLCHGAAGIAHMFNRFFHQTGETIFERAARTWLAHALAMDRPAEPGWLNGSAGVALALLAATTSNEPRWDRALLLS